ncbi:hypothetical protein LPW26_06060 [Rhodopseudomonas sp. HC1]|uniref:hypothetical protein n=1 Tax=Rhodopseudomonas infernalis TaxID=2897386 RepID=UPI001EE946DB|nr:hypothetical protein [Rhodopseudomonas infernalis]MCG6204191.1 hypothetical protein [Rhodopseudomonas infernalis]
MAKSLLAAVHNAVAGAVDDVLNEDDTSAPALNATMRNGSMATNSPPAGGDPNPGISQAAHDAAVTAARAEGVTAGATAATERLSAALGAEGIKGDAGRMAAALDLAVKSPGMSGGDIATFVTGNIAAAKPAATSAADYAAARASASALAQPQAKTDGRSDRSPLAAAVATTNKRR